MRTPVAVVAALSLLPACLGPRVDASRYFTLPAAGTSAVGTPAAGSPGAGATTPVVGLGPVTLPPYLSRPEVATRVGPEQLAYSSTDRWAAPLEDLVTAALFAASLGGAVALLAPVGLAAAPAGWHATRR